MKPHHLCRWPQTPARPPQGPIAIDPPYTPVLGCKHSVHRYSGRGMAGSRVGTSSGRDEYPPLTN
jgi:hypothetical protein